MLGIVKLSELWRDRFRFEVGYSFAGDENLGNATFLRNLSIRPIIPSH